MHLIFSGAYIFFYCVLKNAQYCAKISLFLILIYNRANQNFLNKIKNAQRCAKI